MTTTAAVAGGRLVNWSGTVAFGARRLEQPGSVDELAALVAREPRIRAIGTRHSFNDLADTDGVLFDALRVPPHLELDEARGVVRLTGGTRYAAVAAFLLERGVALHNMGSLPHISVAGAISTGTHGSGARNGSLATAVRGLRFVRPDGALEWVRHGDPDFDASVVSLGLLGPIAEVELAVQPGYLVRQDVYKHLPWSVLLGDVDAVMGAGYSVSVFTEDWSRDGLDQVWVKRRVASADEAVPDELFGVPRDRAATQRIIASSTDNTTQHGVAGAWAERLPHFRIDETPSAGAEIQSEWFVGRDDAAAALAAVRAVSARFADVLLVTELRSIAADGLWLSEAYRRESFALHFTWRPDTAAATAASRLVEDALAPFAPRPHWGKLHTTPGEALRRRYARLGDFEALVARVDPGAKFGSPSLDALLGRAA